MRAEWQLVAVRLSSALLYRASVWEGQACDTALDGEDDRTPHAARRKISIKRLPGHRTRSKASCAIGIGRKPAKAIRVADMAAGYYDPTLFASGRPGVWSAGALEGGGFAPSVPVPLVAAHCQKPLRQRGHSVILDKRVRQQRTQLQRQPISYRASSSATDYRSDQCAHSTVALCASR